MLNNKVILIILDGCRYDVAAKQMGFLASLVEHKKAFCYKVISEMPSNSRPLYEVLLTGKSVLEHKTYTNMHHQKSSQKSIFESVQENGGTTGVAGYYWLSELYNNSPYDILTDRIQHDEDKLIQYGIFYSEDDYPDSHVFADAHHIINQYTPDFMLVHSMNIDDVGHKYTANSAEYHRAVNHADSILAYFIPIWYELGYKIIVTSDHGMDEFGLHGGNQSNHRRVPLFIINEDFPELKETIFSQLKVRSLIENMLGIGNGYHV
ncbi:alkaline phosphatase family protein [Vagococcus lutrae]|uniref:alkaline phosphatase family protein n=1 Tax=Vagococcus lutrae TaxID=81947 RepID=UPI000F862D3B|nr:alkaline phosphatase family protein [Vagococcus lutrae]RST92062.1 nucleotide pyrophosphatase [Vagococcus lutrae]